MKSPSTTSKLRALRDASIWGPHAIDPEDDRVSSWLRIYMPINYAISAAFGVFGFLFGVPAVFAAISPAYGQAWSALVFFASVICILGVALPRLFWRYDEFANNVLVILLSIYSICLIYLAFFQHPPDDHAADRAALAIGSLRLIALPLWRSFDIAREREKRGWK